MKVPDPNLNMKWYFMIVCVRCLSLTKLLFLISTTKVFYIVLLLLVLLLVLIKVPYKGTTKVDQQPSKVAYPTHLI